MVGTATYNEIPKEVQELDRLIDDGDLSATATARSIGISGGALSKIRKGEYGADSGNMHKKIREYLQLQRERREILPKAPFVDILVARKVRDACRMAHVERQIVVLAGPSGIGKTMALKKYYFENKSCMYMAANAACRMHTTMYRVAMMSGASVRGNAAMLAEYIIAALKGTNKMLIVDEADHLNFNAFEMLRYIHDEAGIGIILSGWEEMLHEITGRGTGEGKYSRLYTRCGAVVWLKPLSKKDAGLIIRAVLGNDVKPEIIEKLHEVSRGCARTIVKLLPRAWKVAKADNRGKLTPAIIEETKKQLLMV